MPRPAPMPGSPGSIHLVAGVECRHDSPGKRQAGQPRTLSGTFRPVSRSSGFGSAAGTMLPADLILRCKLSFDRRRPKIP